MNLIFLDFETTGVNEKQDKIIEIGAIRTDLDLNTIDTFHSLINPGISIPSFISQLTNGIDNELVKDAPLIYAIEASFKKFISNDIIVSHNAEFEEKFLKTNFTNIKNKFLDTMDLFPLFFPDSNNLKLDTFVRNLNLRSGGELHRAYEDALDLYKVVLHIKNSIISEHKFYLVAKRILASFSEKEWLWVNFIKNAVKKSNFTDTSYNYKKLIQNNYKDETFLTKNIVLDKDILISSLNNKVLEDRAEQKEYLSYITNAINSDKNLAIEAGTGTGKSLAYLLPAIKWTIDNNKTIVIATKTKALQQQIIDADLPLAKSLLNIKDYDALKVQGRNNYLCIRKLDKFFSSIDLLDDFETKYAKVFFYSFDKLSNLGDLTLIPSWVKNKFQYIDRSIDVLYSDISSCILSRCVFYNDCHYFNMIRLARKSKLLIANHSLVFNWPMHLIRGDKIIYDEAHHLEKEATSSTLELVSSYEIKKILLNLIDTNKSRGLVYNLRSNVDNNIYALTLNTISEINNILDNLEYLVKEFFIKFEILKNKKFDFKYTASVFLYSKDFMYGELNILKEGIWSNLVAEFNNLLLNLKQIIVYLEDNKKIFEADDDRILILSVIEKLDINIRVLNDLISLKEYNSKLNDNIFYIEYSEKFKTWSINKAILDVVNYLNTNIYPLYKTNIFTSATLGTNSSFYGLDSIIKLKSPFNYEKNSKFCFLNKTQSYNDHNFIENLSKFIVEIVKITEGRALVLFSSWYRLEKVFDYIEPILKKDFFEVYKQNKGFDTVENFKTTNKGVLLGTESFAEGLDIKGDKLSVVIMEGAPSIIRDSIFLAREKNFSLSRDKKYFDLEKRVLKLKQWSGRLIRSKTDKGIVIVYDNWYSKLASTYKNYINSELNLMPLYCIDKDEFISWFKDNFTNL